MLKTLTISLFGLSLFVANVCVGQNASALLDRNDIRIGEQAVLSLSYELDKSAMPKVVFPGIEAELVEGVEVIRQSKVDTMATGANVQTVRLAQKIFITSFDSGFYEIPAFTFIVNGKPELTKPLSFTVNTVEIDTTKGIYGSRDGYTVEVGWMDYVKVFLKSDTAKIIGGVLLLAIIVLIVLYVLKKNRKPKQEVVEVIPTIPPHELALAALQKMIDEKRFLDKNIKALHTGITDVLREFLEGVFQIHAHELTSSQIMKELRYAGIDEKSMQSLRKILFRADLVKFAKEKPDTKENEAAILDALEFVKTNIPVVAETPSTVTEDE